MSEIVSGKNQQRFNQSGGGIFDDALNLTAAIIAASIFISPPSTDSPVWGRASDFDAPETPKMSATIETL